MIQQISFPDRTFDIDIGRVFVAVRAAMPELAVAMIWELILFVHKRRYGAVEPFVESMARDYQFQKLATIKRAWANRLRSYLKDPKERSMFRKEHDPILGLFDLTSGPINQYKIASALRMQLDERELDISQVESWIISLWNPLWLEAWKSPRLRDRNRLIGFSAVVSAQAYYFVLIDAALTASKEDIHELAPWKYRGDVRGTLEVLKSWTLRESEFLSVLRKFYEIPSRIVRAVGSKTVSDNAMLSLLSVIEDRIYNRPGEIESPEVALIASVELSQDGLETAESRKVPGWVSLRESNDSTNGSIEAVMREQIVPSMT